MPSSIQNSSMLQVPGLHQWSSCLGSSYLAWLHGLPCMVAWMGCQLPNLPGCMDLSSWSTWRSWVSENTYRYIYIEPKENQTRNSPIFHVQGLLHGCMHGTGWKPCKMEALLGLRFVQGLLHGCMHGMNRMEALLGLRSELLEAWRWKKGSCALPLSLSLSLPFSIWVCWCDYTYGKKCVVCGQWEVAFTFGSNWFKQHC